MEPAQHTVETRSEGIKLGRVFGIPIYLNPSWFVVFLLVTWSLAVGYFPASHPDWATEAHWGLAATSALLLFVSVLIHELAHSLVALRHGLPIASITLYVFGGVARITEEPRQAGVEAQVAVAGPAASLGLAAAFALASRLPLPAPVLAIAGYLAIVNLLLAVFNMLPGFPLDGGRLLRAHLWQRWGSLTRATRAASRAGQALAYVFMAAGGLTLLLGGLVAGLWWLMIGWFLDNAARSGYQHVLVRQALEDVTVGQLMIRDVLSVERDVAVDQFIDDYLLRHPQRTFPVTEDGRLAGLVALEDVRRVAVSDRAGTTVGQIMTPRERLCLAAPDDSAYAALKCMVDHDVGRLPVMVDDSLVGLVSRDQLLRVVALKSEG